MAHQLLIFCLYKEVLKAQKKKKRRLNDDEESESEEEEEEEETQRASGDIDATIVDPAANVTHVENLEVTESRSLNESSILEGNTIVADENVSNIR